MRQVEVSDAGFELYDKEGRIPAGNTPSVVGTSGLLSAGITDWSVTAVQAIPDSLFVPLFCPNRQVDDLSPEFELSQGEMATTATAGDNTLTVPNIATFPTPQTLGQEFGVVYDVSADVFCTFSYSGKSGNDLTGVAGLAFDIVAGDLVSFASPMLTLLPHRSNSDGQLKIPGELTRAIVSARVKFAANGTGLRAVAINSFEFAAGLGSLEQVLAQTVEDGLATPLPTEGLFDATGQILSVSYPVTIFNNLRRGRQQLLVPHIYQSSGGVLNTVVNASSVSLDVLPRSAHHTSF